MNGSIAEEGIRVEELVGAIPSENEQTLFALEMIDISAKADRGMTAARPAFVRLDVEVVEALVFRRSRSR